MAKRILILQSESKSAQVLEDFFYLRGDKTWKTSDPVLATSLLRSSVPGIVFVDLHLQGNWLDFLATIRQKYPNTRVIATSRYPDLRREFMAKEQGVNVFLREPFTPEWIERSLSRLEDAARGEAPAGAPTGILPRVRVSMRWKITFPYTVLAVLFALSAAYLVSRFVLDSIHERFTSQLVDAGRLSADWMVQQENSLLKILRQVSNTQGVAEAVSGSDANLLRSLTLPILINQAAGDMEILNLQGDSILSLRRKPGGGLKDYEATIGSRQFSRLPSVQSVLKGQPDQERDKYAGIAQVGKDTYFFIAGPVFDLQDRMVGVVLVGESLINLVQANRQATMAQVTLYRLDGSVMASTLLMPEAVPPVPKEQIREVLKRQDESTPIRNLAIAVDPGLDILVTSPALAPVRQVLMASQGYTEIIAPWEARGGEDMGLIGVSLAESSLVAPTLTTRVKAFVLVAVAFIGVILIGLVLSRQVTQPLSRVVEASQKVAQGNLEVKLPAHGNDEVAVVAHAFNYMVSGLQEGFIYRDLLGRTVSPEVREALRTSFESGDLRLEGQNTIATVLMSDIRGFTMLAERAEPTTILTWLNEYFSVLVPVITSYGGVIDKFEGDAMLAFFGILPRILPPEESSLHACQAAVEMMTIVEQINQRRKDRHEPPLLTGIGINTGSLIAGGLGTADRLNYTIIGDTVNTTQRIQTVTRKFSEGGVAISESTAQALRGRRGDFRIEPLGEHSFQGKAEQLWLYRLYPAQTGASEKKATG